MNKNHFRFNTETLKYEVEEISFLKLFLKTIIPKLFLSIIIGILFFYILTSFVITPEELYMSDKSSDIKLKYEILNKELDFSVKTIETLQKRDEDIYRMIFQMNSISTSKRKTGFGGSDKYSTFNKLHNSEILINTSKKTDIISHIMLGQSSSYEEIFHFAENIEKMASCIPAIHPISLDEFTRFGSAFGMRMHPILGVYKMHTGVDLTAPRKTNIHSTGNGVVIEARMSSGGYGNIVKVNHGFGFITYYAHMNRILVKVGQKVKRGDVIGLVGNTGRSVAPHLHYEVRINNKPVNPVNYYYEDLTDEQYNEMIKVSTTVQTHVFE